MTEIEFPSIQRPETAKFIFEFINFLRHRTRGNSVFPFSKLQDIEETLKRQWSLLFQRLLLEQRARAHAAKRFEDLSERFEDLKAAILTSIGSNKEREVARGVVRFRRLIGFVRNLGVTNLSFPAHGKPTWQELFNEAKIIHVITSEQVPPLEFEGRIGPRPRAYLIKEDRTFFELRAPMEYMFDLEEEWNSFVELPQETRSIIIEALSEMGSFVGPLRFRNENFDTYINRRMAEQHQFILNHREEDGDATA